jgi:hypothetical protein
MNKILFLLLILFLFGCGQLTQEDFDDEPFSFDTTIFQDTMPYIGKDSILKIADEVMKRLKFKENLRKDMVNQIHTQMENEKMSKEQIQNLEQQSYSYEQQIEDYRSKRIVKKDSIIYNIQHRDTIIYKPVYIPDTIIVEVLDTIKVKKLSRKKRKKKKLPN